MMVNLGNKSNWLLLAAFAATSTVTSAQATRHGKMALDTTDQACMQLKDNNVWASKVTYMAGVGTVTSLATALTNLDDTPVKLTSSTHPPVVGYIDGLAWDSGDMSSTAWIPQGLTHGTSGSTSFAITSWHWNTDAYSYDNGSRISLIDTTSLSSSQYR
ncbi:MAG: hypothetical protein V4555_08730, partial [Acidobacteriota bacterium]